MCYCKTRSHCEAKPWQSLTMEIATLHFVSLAMTDLIIKQKLSLPRRRESGLISVWDFKFEYMMKIFLLLYWIPGSSPRMTTWRRSHKTVHVIPDLIRNLANKQISFFPKFSPLNSCIFVTKSTKSLGGKKTLSLTLIYCTDFHLTQTVFIPKLPTTDFLLYS